QVLELRAREATSGALRALLRLAPETTTRVAGGEDHVVGLADVVVGDLLRAERVGADTLLARIVQTVAEAQRSRAPIQRLADRVSGWFVPAVIAAAAITFAVWGWFGPEPRFAHALVNAEALELLEGVKTVVVDKTGTLTEGKTRLVSVQALDGFDERTILSFAASV